MRCLPVVGLYNGCLIRCSRLVSMTRRQLLTSGAAALARRPSSFAADAPYRPSRENLKARQWFQDARFGLFVHWGVYSVLGNGEWVMNNTRMSVGQYEKLPP